MASELHLAELLFRLIITATTRSSHDDDGRSRFMSCHAALQAKRLWAAMRPRAEGHRAHERHHLPLADGARLGPGTRWLPGELLQPHCFQLLSTSGGAQKPTETALTSQHRKMTFGTETGGPKFQKEGSVWSRVDGKELFSPEEAIAEAGPGHPFVEALFVS